MTIIESKTHIIQLDNKEIFDFLSDLNNHKLIMPPQIVNWNSEVDFYSCTIQGTGEFKMKREGLKPYQKISLINPNSKPFDYKLDWNIYEDGKVQAILEADLNMMLKLLASQPLQNFINLQMDNLVKHLHQN